LAELLHCLDRQMAVSPASSRAFSCQATAADGEPAA
jgi:hypothetical protein